MFKVVNQFYPDDIRTVLAVRSDMSGTSFLFWDGHSFFWSDMLGFDLYEVED